MSIYADDWDSEGRSERVDVINVSTGTVLDSTTLSSFSGGAYLSWQLSGHVQIRVTNLGGPNAVISGLFFDPINSSTFESENTTTQGNWEGVYGKDGYDIIGNQSSLPSYAVVTTTNALNYVWSSSTTDVRALVEVPVITRTAACWTSTAGQFSIDINLTDGLTHQVTIYADDYDNLGLSERVDVINPSTGAVLDSRTISSFSGGVYLSWNLTGNVQLQFTGLTGNPVVSGLFVNDVNSKLFLSADTTTQGNWEGVYGKDGYDVIGNQSSLPSYAVVTPTNTTTQVWSSSTTDVRALENATPGATNRIAASWYNSAGQFSIDINLTDGLTHVVTVYADDYDNVGLSERVDVIDPTTGAVLDFRTISSFSGGVYLSWQLAGHVQLRVTALAGPAPVISGLFFDPVNSAMFVSAETTTPGEVGGSLRQRWV